MCICCARTDRTCGLDIAPVCSGVIWDTVMTSQQSKTKPPGALFHSPTWSVCSYASMSWIMSFTVAAVCFGTLLLEGKCVVFSSLLLLVFIVRRLYFCSDKIIETPMFSFMSIGVNTCAVTIFTGFFCNSFCNLYWVFLHSSILWRFMTSSRLWPFQFWVVMQSSKEGEYLCNFVGQPWLRN